MVSRINRPGNSFSIFDAHSLMAGSLSERSLAFTKKRRLQNATADLRPYRDCALDGRGMDAAEPEGAGELNQKFPKVA